MGTQRCGTGYAEMSELTGHCLCRAVTFRLTAPVRDVHHCHCGMCRRATGATFATLVWVPRDAVVWTRTEPARFRSSDIVTRGFCGRCGTSLLLDYDGRDQIALLLGAFDDPASLRPSHHYGIEGRLVWVDINADLPGRETDIDPRP